MSRALLDALKQIAENETCLTCECLQGALATLVVETGDAALRAEAKSLRVGRDRIHSCLGCEPCPPADQLVTYRSRKAGQALGSCECGCH